MENLTETNGVRLSGRVLKGPVFNHKTYGEAFYLVLIGVLRRSGYEDKLRLIVSEKLMGGRSPREGELLEIHGQIRTYNREVDGRSKLEVTVFVREMAYCRGDVFEYVNEVCLEGFLCKETK